MGNNHEPVLVEKRKAFIGTRSETLHVRIRSLELCRRRFVGHPLFLADEEYQIILEAACHTPLLAHALGVAGHVR